MLKWGLTVALAVIVLGFASGRLQRLGLWRLPGDFTLHWRGRRIEMPITTTLLLCAALTLLLRVFRV